MEAKEDNEDKITETSENIENTEKSNEEQSSEDDFSFSLPKFNFKKITNLKVTPYLKKYGFLVVLLFILLISIYLKIQPLYLPYAETWAENEMHAHMEKEAMKQIAPNFPNLPPPQLRELVQQEIQAAKKQQHEKISKETKLLAQKYRDQFQDPQGQTYLSAIDPYHYYRYAKLIVENGFMGDEIRDGIIFYEGAEPADGITYDTHMLAPIGKPTRPSFHPYVSSYVYHILHFFDKGTTVLLAVFLMPLIMITLSIIPLFFIIKKVAGTTGAFFGSLYLTLNTAMQTKSIAGASDTETYVIFLFSFILWLFLLAFDAKTIKTRIIYIAIAGMTLGVFNFAWTGWWICGYLILGTSGLYFLFLLFRKRKQYLAFFKAYKEKNNRKYPFLKKVKTIMWDLRRLRETWITPLGIFIFVIPILMLIRGKEWFLNLKLFFILPFSSLTIAEATKTGASLWPNVYTTVRELGSISYMGIVKHLGGWFFFGIGVLAILFLLSQYKKKIPFLLGILLTLWLSGMMYISHTTGQRFILNVVPIIGIAFGIGIGILFSTLLKNMKKIVSEENKYHQTAKIGAAIIFIILIGFTLGVSPIPPFCNHGICETTKNHVTSVVPEFDDGWHNTLDKIRLESKPNAIINSWWDFGHFFKVYGDRAVTFDGASQNVPQAHWMGKALVTSNEKESVAILRMLNCGANTAYDLVEKKQKDQLASLKIIYTLLKQNKGQARATLKKEGYSEEEINEISKNMYCTPPESFLITSEDMVAKSTVWTYFGNWNFEYAWIWDHTSSLPRTEAIEAIQEKLEYTEELAEKTYDEMISFEHTNKANLWIGPVKLYGGVTPCKQEGQKVICPLQVQNMLFTFEIDLLTKDTRILESEEKTSPYSVTWFNEQGFQEKVLDSKDSLLNDRTISLLGTDGDYSIILMEKGLEKSMFNRLFFFHGAGLQHFTQFNRQPSTTTKDIITWKINWDI